LFAHATGPHAYNHTPHDAAHLIQPEALQRIGDFMLHATGLISNTRELPYPTTDVETYWLRSSIVATAAPHDPGRVPAVRQREDKSMDERRLPELVVVKLSRTRLAEISRLRSVLSTNGWTVVRDASQVSAGSAPGALLVVDAMAPDELALWWELGARMVQVRRGMSQKEIDEAERAGFKFLVRDARALDSLRVLDPVVLWPVEATLDPRQREKLVDTKAVLALEFHAQTENGRASNGPMLQALLARLKELRRDLPAGQILLAPDYAEAGEAVSLSDIVHALRKEGWSREEVSGILGGNFLRVLRPRPGR
jgi:hypothetical protein